MSPPTITRSFGEYTYSDSERGIRVLIKRLYQRHYDISAHVTITVRDSHGEEYDLYKARTPITTSTARKRLADDVSQTLWGDEKKGDEGMKAIFGLNSPVMMNDWRATINGSCEVIEARYYAGEAPQNLYDVSILDEEVWRIPTILSEDVNVLYGHSGSGKSYISIILGQAIHHGVHFSGIPARKGNVLLIDYETTPAKMKKRFKRVDAGLGVVGDPMWYIPANVPLAQMVEPLQNYITQHDIDFIIIDSLQRAVGGRITDEEGVGMFFDAIRQLERACLIIHHTNKGDDYYGSPYIRANARSLYRLRSVHNEGQSQLSIQLEQEKENDGPSTGSLGFVLDFVGDPLDPEAVIVSDQDASMQPDFQKYQSLVDRMKYIVEETELHRLEWERLKEELGLNDPKNKRAGAERETLRNYHWAMENKRDNPNKEPKYKKLGGLFFLDSGDVIHLETELGRSASTMVNGDNANIGITA